MSWQQYVDSMMSTKHMTGVGIFGLDGSTWAASAGFPVSRDYQLINYSLNTSLNLNNFYRLEQTVSKK